MQVRTVSILAAAVLAATASPLRQAAAQGTAPGGTPASPNAAQGMGMTPGVGSGSSYGAGERPVGGRSPDAGDQQREAGQREAGQPQAAAVPDSTVSDCASVKAAARDSAACPPRPTASPGKGDPP